MDLDDLTADEVAAKIEGMFKSEFNLDIEVTPSSGFDNYVFSIPESDDLDEVDGLINRITTAASAGIIDIVYQDENDEHTEFEISVYELEEFLNDFA